MTLSLALSLLSSTNTHVFHLFSQMGMEHCVYWVDVVALVSSFLLFRLLSYAVLRIRLSTTKPIPAVTVITRMVKTHLNINLR